MNIVEQLVRLPNGDWVMPSHVVMVEAVAAEHDEEMNEACGGSWDTVDRVIMNVKGNTHVYDCKTFADACDMRDAIVEAIQKGQKFVVDPVVEEGLANL